MCGIGGVWCFEGEELTKEDARRLKRLAVYLETRGTDAFGFYNGEEVIKFPGSASDVIDMIDRIRPFEELVERRNMFLMHTRAYTEGDPLKNANNHPFESKDIVMAHNGVVHMNVKYTVKGNNENLYWKNGKYDYYDYVEEIDVYEIFGDEDVEIPETDSFHILVEIQKEYNKRVKFVDAIESVLFDIYTYSDYALWVYCKTEDKLALARSSRPLFIARDGNKLWFASEEWMLKYLKLKNVHTLYEGEFKILSRKGVDYVDYIEIPEQKKKKDWNYYLEKEYEEWKKWRNYFLY